MALREAGQPSGAGGRGVSVSAVLDRCNPTAEDRRAWLDLALVGKRDKGELGELGRLIGEFGWRRGREAGREGGASVQT